MLEYVWLFKIRRSLYSLVKDLVTSVEFSNSIIVKFLLINNLGFKSIKKIKFSPNVGPLFCLFSMCYGDINTTVP